MFCPVTDVPCSDIAFLMTTFAKQTDSYNIPIVN
jgi:hypothetical protein